MKKMVVLSLLVLSFPLAAFADTSESIPAETVGSSQEQVIESTSVPEETGIDDELSTVPTETQTSSEETVKNQKTATEDTATKETIKKETSKEAPTAETSTVETKQAEKAKTSESVDKKTDAIAPQQASEIIQKSQSSIEKDLINEWNAGVIRENLKVPDYGIDQNELNSYTDEELTNAYKLFIRYNFDFAGMDLGSYVRVLRMIYKDKEVSWAEVEKALMFNPHDFQTTAELANNIDQLQYYLRVLHPGIRHFSNDELSYILNQLSSSEKELSAAINLFSGILFRLNDYPEITLPTNDMAKPVSTIQNLATTTKPIVQSVLTIPNNNAAVKSDVSAQATGQKEYPKTGERHNVALTISGIAVFLLAGLVILKRRAHVK